MSITKKSPNATSSWLQRNGFSLQNYFNYFTEIEERFQQRRGSLLMLSTLDWALIETWREAGIPLEAALRGIDSAFDKHDARKARSKHGLRRVNGLAWCAQEVMATVEQMKEAATGSMAGSAAAAASAEGRAEQAESGFEPLRIAAYLQGCAAQIAAAAFTASASPAAAAAKETAARLREIAATLQTADGGADAGAKALQTTPPPVRTEDVELNLTVLEEKLFAALTASAPEEELLALKQQAAQELAPYRGKMGAVQIRQVEQQFLRKRLLEARKLPRLSLFYMSHL